MGDIAQGDAARANADVDKDIGLGVDMDDADEQDMRTEEATLAAASTEDRGDVRIAVGLAGSLCRAPPPSNLDVRGSLLAHLVLDQSTPA